MACDGCQLIVDGRLVQIYQASERSGFKAPGKVFLCPQCLCGEFIPAFRPSLKAWRIGQVVDFDESRSQFHLLFDDSAEHEWVTLESSPFDSYVAEHDERSRSDITEGSGLFSVSSWPDEDDDYDDFSEELMPDDFRQQGSSESSLRGLTPLRFVTSTAAGVHGNEDITLLGECNQFTSYPQQRARVLVEPGFYLADLSKNGDDSKPATGPRLWTMDEDRILLEAILRSPTPMKWPQIAESIPNRTAKQCRERYYNYLKPNVKLSEWSPAEDCLLFHTQALMGPRWAAIARLLPGRTDNSVKNRFHRLMKQANKSGQSRHVRADTGHRFGDLVVPVDDEDATLCTRCSLAIPSLQTGRTISVKTGWCRSCVDTPTHICGDNLRRLHIHRGLSSVMSTK